jgi:hypothetical protein
MKAQRLVICKGEGSAFLRTHGPSTTFGSSSVPFDTTWSVAVFTSRESIETLASTIDAALTATIDRHAVIDVIVNGNRALADEAAHYVNALQAVGNTPKLVRVWYIGIANKAHAWNVYANELWPGSEIAYFVDGYVQVKPDAFALIAEGLGATPNALAGTAVPTVGRSAKALREWFLRAGLISGNCFALRGQVLNKLRDRGFRLPLGIYYHDALITSIICFDLDPSTQRYDSKRILVHPQATWTYRPLAWWRFADLRTQWKRMMRQAHGLLEDRAIRFALSVRKSPIDELPRTVDKLIRNWLDGCPGEARGVFLRNPLCYFAARKLSYPQDWSQTAAALPILVTRGELPWQPGRSINYQALQPRAQFNSTETEDTRSFSSPS